MTGNARRAPTRARSTPETKLRRKAQGLAGDALETLKALMESEKAPAPIRLAAAREMLDRGFGRPRLGGSEGPPDGGGMTVIVKRYSDITPEELARADEGEP